MGHGALDAEIKGADLNSADVAVSDSAAQASHLGLGDTVTVRLTNLEFSGLTGLAQMMAAAKAPARLKPIIEKTPVFSKIGAGLDLAYGFLRSGLEFSSTITQWESTEDSLTYVDEGMKLPKPLKTWTHTHRIAESDQGGVIVDELTVDVEPSFAAPLVEAALKFHLESRAKAYKKVFEQV